MDIINDYILPAIPYAALVAAVVSLFWIYGVQAKYEKLVSRVRELNNTLSLNTTAFTAKSNEVNASQIIDLELKIVDLNNRTVKLEKFKDIERIASEQKTVSTAEPAPAVKNDITYYAKFPDADEGFTDKWLTQQQNGEQVYELILTPSEGKGTFFISQQPDVQRYALSDINYYLPKGCTFMNQPGKSGNIKLIEAGTLTRSGDVWVIEEKIKIEFA